MKNSHCCLRKRILAIGSMLLLLMVSSGCIAVAAGAGASAIAYIRGELNTSLEATIAESAEAAQAAIADLRLTEISSKADALTAELIARDAQDNKIVIS